MLLLLYPYYKQRPKKKNRKKRKERKKTKEKNPQFLIFFPGPYFTRHTDNKPNSPRIKYPLNQIHTRTGLNYLHLVQCGIFDEPVITSYHHTFVRLYRNWFELRAKKIDCVCQEKERTAGFFLTYSTSVKI